MVRTGKAKAIAFGFAIFFLLVAARPSAAHEGADVATSVAILVYHRFGEVASDNMTVTATVFESHLRTLQRDGYTVIPLRTLVAFFRGEGPPPPPRAVVITADDGHRSVYSSMFPLITRYRVPVTLFIYPSAISNASYAMTWAQLDELQRSGLFDIQSHTYWHPNFAREKRRLGKDDYERLVDSQLTRAKRVLERNLGIHVEFLAWPFGIHDDNLALKAREAGYVAAFTLERRHARATDPLMALPRYLMTDADRGHAFERLLAPRHE